MVVDSSKKNKNIKKISSGGLWCHLSSGVKTLSRKAVLHPSLILFQFGKLTLGMLSAEPNLFLKDFKWIGEMEKIPNAQDNKDIPGILGKSGG